MVPLPVALVNAIAAQQCFPEENPALRSTQTEENTLQIVQNTFVMAHGIVDPLEVLGISMLAMVGMFCLFILLILSCLNDIEDDNHWAILRISGGDNAPAEELEESDDSDVEEPSLVNLASFGAALLGVALFRDLEDIPEADQFSAPSDALRNVPVATAVVNVSIQSCSRARSSSPNSVRRREYSTNRRRQSTQTTTPDLLITSQAYSNDINSRTGQVPGFEYGQISRPTVINSYSSVPASYRTAFPPAVNTGSSASQRVLTATITPLSSQPTQPVDVSMTYVSSTSLTTEASAFRILPSPLLTESLAPVQVEPAHSHNTSPSSVSIPFGVAVLPPDSASAQASMFKTPIPSSQFRMTSHSVVPILETRRSTATVSSCTSSLDENGSSMIISEAKPESADNLFGFSLAETLSSERPKRNILIQDTPIALLSSSNTGIVAESTDETESKNTANESSPIVNGGGALSKVLEVQPNLDQSAVIARAKDLRSQNQSGPVSPAPLADDLPTTARRQVFASRVQAWNAFVDSSSVDSMKDTPRVGTGIQRTSLGGGIEKTARVGTFQQKKETLLLYNVKEESTRCAFCLTSDELNSLKVEDLEESTKVKTLNRYGTRYDDAVLRLACRQESDTLAMAKRSKNLNLTPNDEILPPERTKKSVMKDKAHQSLDDRSEVNPQNIRDSSNISPARDEQIEDEDNQRNNPDIDELEDVHSENQENRQNNATSDQVNEDDDDDHYHHEIQRNNEVRKNRLNGSNQTTRQNQLIEDVSPSKELKPVSNIDEIDFVPARDTVDVGEISSWDEWGMSFGSFDEDYWES